MSWRWSAASGLGLLLALLPALPATTPIRGDAPELTLVALSGGVAHAPGYPLWTRLAALWLALLPGDPGWLLALQGLLYLALATASLSALLAAPALSAAPSAPSPPAATSPPPAASPLAASPPAVPPPAGASRSPAAGPGWQRAATAAGLALCWAILPAHWRTVLAPEVYGLELALWAGALACVQRPRSRAAGLLLAGLAAGHRPTALPLWLGLSWWALRRAEAGSARRRLGLAATLGPVLSALGLLHLWWQARTPHSAWVAAALQVGPAAYLSGQGLAGSRLGWLGLDAWWRAWGAQGAAVALGGAALGLGRQPLDRVLGLCWLTLLAWSLLWVVPDPEASALPLLLLGVIGWSRLLVRRLPIGLLPIGLLPIAGTLALLNRAAAPGPCPGHPCDGVPLARRIGAAPAHAAVLSRDWSERTGLVLAARQQGRAVSVVPVPEEADCAAVARWMTGGPPMWLPEERRLLALPAVVETGPELVPCLERAGLRAEEVGPGRWRVGSGGD